MLGAGDVFGCSLPAVRRCWRRAAWRLVASSSEGSPALVQWLNLRLRAQLCALPTTSMLAWLGRKSAMERLT